MAGSRLNEANKKLAVLAQRIETSRYTLGEMPELNANEPEKITQIREAVVGLRTQLNKAQQSKAQQSKEVAALQKAIHDALIALTKLSPLNERTIANEIVCPLTKKVISNGKGVALSNGCFYYHSALSRHSDEKTLFPRARVLLGSDFEIDQEDVAVAQTSDRQDVIALGALLGMAAGIAPWSLVAIPAVAALTALLAAPLILVAALIVFVLFTMGVGAALGNLYYDKKARINLEPAGGSDLSSSAQVFVGTDVQPAVPAPAVATPVPQLALLDEDAVSSEEETAPLIPQAQNQSYQSGLQARPHY